VKILNLYISKNYATLLNISKNITSNTLPDYEDLLHDVLLDLYNKDQELIQGMIKRKELAYYVIKMLVNQYHSGTSPFFSKYKKYYSINKQYLKEYIFNTRAFQNRGKHIDELILNEERLKWIEDKLKNVRWFDASVFRVYYSEGHSLSSLEKATKINRNTLGKSIRIVKKYLKYEQKK